MKQMKLYTPESIFFPTEISEEELREIMTCAPSGNRRAGAVHHLILQQTDLNKMLCLLVQACLDHDHDIQQWHLGILYQVIVPESAWARQDSTPEMIKSQKTTALCREEFVFNLAKIIHGPNTPLALVVRGVLKDESVAETAAEWLLKKNACSSEDRYSMRVNFALASLDRSEAKIQCLEVIKKEFSVWSSMVSEFFLEEVKDLPYSEHEVRDRMLSMLSS